MRPLAALALAMLLAAGLAGCTGASQDPAEPGVSPTPSPDDGGGGETAAGTPSVTFVWAPAFPRVGAQASFIATVDAQGHGEPSRIAWTFDGEPGPEGADVRHAFADAGEHEARVDVTFADGATASKVRKPFVTAPPGEEGPAPPVGGNGTLPNATYAPPVFACPGGNVTEAQATFGASEELPGLAWAVLKTGFRAAVAWQGSDATAASIEYTVDGGPARAAAETLPGKAHLFVLEGLPTGGHLCFRATEGSTTTAWHGMRLENAMTAYDPALGVYTVNYLVLANEGADLNEVEAGLARHARLLWDSTDGYVRMGATLLVTADPMHANGGWVQCYVAFGLAGCPNAFDVLFTHDASPQGAASTYRRGVRDPDAAIWMNQYHQAMPGPLSMDDAGAVLVHESGHYLFDMDDLYGTPVTSGCDVPALDLSIMGGSRDTSEFDDEAHPCTDQGSGYVPSWTLLRGEFEEVPERAIILEGPDGDGGVHVQRTYRGI